MCECNECIFKKGHTCQNPKAEIDYNEKYREVVCTEFRPKVKYEAKYED